MSKIFSPEVDVDVRRLSKEGYTTDQIKEKLKAEGTTISKSSISCIINNVGIRRLALNDKKEIPKFQRPPIKRTPALVKEVECMVTKENPETYRNIKNKKDIGLDTICKIIHREI
jgi:hypothetical protein